MAPGLRCGVLSGPSFAQEVARGQPTALVAASPDPAVRDALVESVSTWHAALRRTIIQCKENGDLRADTDESQMLFEVHGLILVLHYEARFMRLPDSLPRARRGFDNILQRYGTPQA